MARYSKEGVDYVSVTEILDEIWNKGESFWKWKLFTKQAAEKASVAAAKGTKIHSLVNKTSQGKRTYYPKIYRPLKPRIEEYFKDKTIVLSEKSLFSVRGFAGTPDVLYQTGQDFVLEDTKTGKYREHEHKLQLGGYYTLLNDNGYTVSKARVCKIQGVDIIPLDWIEKAELDRLSKLFLNLLELYQWKNKINLK